MLCIMDYTTVSSCQKFSVVFKLTQDRKSACFSFTFSSAIYFSALCCLLQGHRDLVNVKPWVFDVGQWNSIDLLWAFPFRSFKTHSLLCLTSKLDCIKIHTAEIYPQPLNDEVNLALSSMCLLLFYASVTLGKVEFHLI